MSRCGTRQAMAGTVLATRCGGRDLERWPTGTPGARRVVRTACTSMRALPVLSHGIHAGVDLAGVALPGQNGGLLAWGRANLVRSIHVAHFASQAPLLLFSRRFIAWPPSCSNRIRELRQEWTLCSRICAELLQFCAGRPNRARSRSFWSSIQRAPLSRALPLLLQRFRKHNSCC
jgi:hypothetical protein